MNRPSRIVAQTLVARGIVCALAVLLFAAGGAPQKPQVSQDDQTLTVRAGDQTLSVSLADGALRLQSPSGEYTLTPALQLGEGWTRPSRAEGVPSVKRLDDAARVEIVYPVPEQRRFTIEVETRSHPGVVFVTSRLEVLDSPRGQYYYWQTSATSDRYVAPCPDGTEQKLLDTAAWAPLPWREWWFLPRETGGLLVLPTNVGGRAPGPAGGVFLHALPRSAVIAPGDALEASFGLAAVADADAAARVAGRAHAPKPRERPKWEYGKLAPRWLREAEVYNLYYHPAAQWTDEVVDKQLRGFPFIIGSTPDGAALERCHKAGVRLLHYVVYTCLLDTELQVREGGTVYSEWTESIDNESRDLKDHPDWVCIDEKGEIQHDAWGQAHHHPGLLNTCLHQQGLHEAAVRQVRMLMEAGYDGVFVDLAGPTVECYGPKFGKHTHPDDHTNTQAYEELLREIYATVKSYGDDRVVIQNTCVSVMPSHWPYTDAQMLEAFPFGGDSTELRQPWPELKWTAERNAEAVSRGKVVVTLPYFGKGETEDIRRAARFSHAYAQLAGFLWADAFSLRGIAGNETFAEALYQTRVGRPTSDIRATGEALCRRFEQGLVALNPSPWPARIADGEATVQLAPESGQVVVGEAR